MRWPPKRRLAIAALVVIAAVALLLPRVVRGYWSMRASNPVRRGTALASTLGCFSCHGDLGSRGIPDPGMSDGEVPSWSGGVWMMYVENDEEIRSYILDGKLEDGHGHERGIGMPAYREFVDERELADLVAAFKVLSGMSVPERETPERRGYESARRWGCFGCHGPGGSGGLPNPGSFTGFVPGWYGADFRDLVRDRSEFDAWIRRGSIPRLREHRLASYFLRRQRIPMPAYERMSAAELDDLWAYTAWLADSGGGTEGRGKPW